MLNVNQQAALDSTGNTVVVAGPGSGKTRVIIAKIGKTYRDQEYNRVCAVTFTRDAADELVRRVIAEFGDKLAAKCRFGTFHSLAIQQLRDAGMLGQLATPQQQSVFINQAAKIASTADDPISYEVAVERIESAKCSLIQRPEAMQDPVVSAYQKLLSRNRVSDLYDVIREAVMGMRDGAVKPMHAGSLACTHLLVDEFQDSDEVQYAWIMEHVNRGVVTTVVGDDDQTIFEWRRALGYSGIVAFKQDAHADEIVLGDNYRCHREILSYADNLIRNNKGNRIEKNLVAAKGPGGKVEIFTKPSIKDQAQALVERIEPFLVPIQEPGRFLFTLPTGSWAIIARNHGTLHAIESALNAKHIQYQRASGGFWKQYFLVVYLDLLKSIQLGSSTGVDSGLHFAGAGNESIERLHNATGGKLGRFLNNKMKPFEDIPKDDQQLFQRFTASSAEWRLALAVGDYDMVINGVSAFLQVEGLYRENDRDKCDALDSAAEILRKYGTWQIKMSDGRSRPPSLAERVAIVTEPNKKTTDGVALHTMHSCKGLEFDSVGVLHVSDGMIPNPERPDDINDRRLLYVAMTRAKNNLYMSYKTGACSRFIRETGISLK